MEQIIKKYFWLIGIVFIFTYLSPYIINGEDSYVLIHDNLDQSPIQNKFLYQESKPFLNEGPSERIMNGNTIVGQGLNLKVGNLPYFFFKPFTAFLLLQFLVRLVAFFGFFALLRALKFDYLISLGCSLIFALLPFYPPTNFTVAILPILSLCFYESYKSRMKYYHWLLLFLIPFFSSLLLVPFFLIVIAAFFLIIDFLKQKRVSWKLFYSLLFVSIIYLISEYKLIGFAFGNSNVVSHRLEFLSDSKSLIESIISSLRYLIIGQEHVLTYHAFLFAILLNLVLYKLIHSCFRNKPIHINKVFFYRIKEFIIDSLCLKRIISVFFLIFLISVIAGIYYWGPIIELRIKMGIFSAVQWNRFYWLFPLLWPLLFAYLFKYIKSGFNNGKNFIIGLIIFQILILFYQSNYFEVRRNEKITYKEFFAENQFNEIKEFIGENQSEYKVVSLGLFPSIPLYNGFYCLDGYSSNYDLNYKHEFREIIKAELEKNEGIQKYYDNWGSRCYIFSNALGKDYICTKYKNKEIIELNLDTGKVKQLGGEFLISSVKIIDADINGLEMLKIFEDSDSAWKIFLYKFK